MRDEHLHAFVGDARARAAADTRRRGHWLTRQLAEDRTFDDVWRAAADAGGPVEVVVRGGRRHRGVAHRAGALVLALTAGGAPTVYVATRAMSALRTLPVGACGDPGVPPAAVLPGPRIADVVHAVAAAGGAAVLGCGADGVHRGRLAGAGRDVAWFDDGTHVRLPAVTDVAT